LSVPIEPPLNRASVGEDVGKQPEH
jgi:hypothetical protein